jgi:hypothetical protein
MTADAPAPAQPDMGLFARLIGVITSPRATFEQVVAKPRPAGALLISALLLGLAAGLPQFTETGRQAVLTNQVETQEQFMGRPLTDEEYGRAERMSHYGGYFAMGGTLVSMPIMALIFGGLYWVTFNTIMGGTASFKQVLAIVTHSQIIGAVGAVLAAPIMYMQGKFTAGGPFNLRALVPMLDDSSTIARVLGFTNIFMIWGLVVTAIGLSVLYRRKSLNIAIGLLLVFFVIVFTLFSVFGGGGRAGR